MWASAIISLLTAIFKAFPSIEGIIRMAIEEANKANIVEAANRKQEKDKAVDDAINGNDSTGCNA